jgi:uncharacterized protein
MEIEFDDIKNEKNIALRGLSMKLISDFNWNSSFTENDNRQDYGEKRLNTIGRLQDKIIHFTWTPRAGKIRIISLRDANKNERKLYEEFTKSLIN